MTKFDSRLRQQCSKLYSIVVGVLSLAPCYVRKKQVQVVDQTTHPPKCHSFVGLDRQIGSSPPANVRLLEMKKFYICSDVTHTHTRTHQRSKSACLARSRQNREKIADTPESVHHSPELSTFYRSVANSKWIADCRLKNSSYGLIT